MMVLHRITRRRLWLTVAAGLMLMVLIVTVLATPWSPLGGRVSIPERRRIASMRVDPFYDFIADRQIPALDIPEKHWDAVLAALTPSAPTIRTVSAFGTERPVRLDDAVPVG